MENERIINKNVIEILKGKYHWQSDGAGDEYPILYPNEVAELIDDVINCIPDKDLTEDYYGEVRKAYTDGYNNCRKEFLQNLDKLPELPDQD